VSRAPGSFGGHLGLVSLFDLSQLLQLNRGTGCLTAVSAGRKGYLYFLEGKLVNAVDDAYKEGELAAYHILSWRDGMFEFTPEPPGDSATIDAGTDAVLLEAARRIDESGQAEGETSQTERLQQHRGALDALRDVFQRVAGEAAADPSLAPPVPVVDLFSLSNPGDRLVYRATHPPQIRQRDGWVMPDPKVMGPGAYVEVRSRLLDASTPGPVEVPGDVPSRRILLADGRTIAVEFVNEGPDESIWLRPVRLRAPDPAGLDGDLARLGSILDDPHGWILVGGPDPESARRLFHAVIAAMAERFSDTILLASSDSTYEHAEGLIVRVTPQLMVPALRSLHPEVVAVDPGVGTDAIALESLEPAPRVLGGVVAPDAASMVPRWLARIARGDLGLARGWLGTLPLALVLALPAPEDPTAIPFAAWRLSPQDRALALDGRTAELAGSLQRDARTPKLKAS